MTSFRLEPWIFHIGQRSALQLPQEHPQPDASHRRQCDKTHPSQWETLRGRRLDPVDEIHEAHNDDGDADAGEQSTMPFDAPAQQNREWNREMENHKQYGN